MFNLFKKKPKRVYTPRKKFEDEFIIKMNEMITRIEMGLDKEKWEQLLISGVSYSLEQEWLMLCRRFIDLINRIKKG